MGHLRDIGSGKPYYYNIKLGVRKNIEGTTIGYGNSGTRKSVRIWDTLP